MATRFVPVPKDWKKLKHHELASLVEFGAGIDMDHLAAGMRSNGYDPDEPIILHEGKILDGRHRHAGAVAADVTPTFKVFEGTDPLTYVYKKALRQHLTTSQRAMLAAEIAKRTAGRPSCQMTESPPKGGDYVETSGVEESTNREAAKALNVSEHTVERAKTVLAGGTPEQIREVKEGTKTVAAAAAEVKKGRKKKAKPSADDAAAEEPEVPKDGNGVLWEEKAPKALKALAFAPKLREMSRVLAGMIRDLAADDGPKQLYSISMQSCIAAAKTLKETLLGAVPAYVCPYCEGTTKILEGAQKGKSCEVCHRQGWVTKSVYRRSPAAEATK